MRTLGLSYTATGTQVDIPLVELAKYQDWRICQIKYKYYQEMLVYLTLIYFYETEAQYLKLHQ